MSKQHHGPDQACCSEKAQGSHEAPGAMHDGKWWSAFVWVYYAEDLRLVQKYVLALALKRPLSSVLALNGSILGSTPMTSWCSQMRLLNGLCVLCPNVMLGDYANQHSLCFDVHPATCDFYIFCLVIYDLWHVDKEQLKDPAALQSPL